jgi:hypothetical protein
MLKHAYGREWVNFISHEEDPDLSAEVPWFNTRVLINGKLNPALSLSSSSTCKTKFYAADNN